MKMVPRALALVSLSVLLLGLSGPGCQPECDPDRVVWDNRDRQLAPDFDYDWICTPILKSDLRDSPPSEPDISGSWPPDVGPKDPDAVVKMAVLLQSCLPTYQVLTPRLNRTISQAYFEHLFDAVRQAMFSRSGCFKDKFNGCDAVRECYGIVEEHVSLPGKDSQPPKPLPTRGCVDGIRRQALTYRGAGADVAKFESTWVNCKGLGLECYDEYQLLSSWCTSARTLCEPEETVSSCKDDRVYRCFDDWAKNKISYYYEKPRCSDFGLSCEEENGYPLWTPNEEWSHCTGTGAACTVDPNADFVSNGAIFSYNSGIACESDTVLRACVSGGEQLVDCTQLGIGFKCINEGAPKCGLAAECTPDTPATCNGGFLIICDAGKIRKFDCKTLGFSYCDDENSACGPNNLY